MGVKTVYYIEIFRIFRGLYRKIRRASSAKDQYVDFSGHGRRLFGTIDLYSFCQDLYRLRIPSRKYGRQLHIGIML